MKLEYIVTGEERMLKEFILEMGISRALARKIKLYGEMYINDEIAKNYFLVKESDKVTLIYNETMNEEINEVKKDIEILYEDEYLMVVFKENNLASQPSHRHQEDNLISHVKSYFIKKGITSNIHLVNRLDFSTSGILIVAKDGYTHYELTKNNDIVRKYLAVVKGILDKKEDRVIVKIERECEGSIKRMVREDGKLAITNYKVIKEFEDESLVELDLETGRTHQIRVTMSYLNHPLIGDKLYGTEKDDLMLYCYYLKFYHPFKKEFIEIKKLPNWDKYLKDIEIS